jgi:hypothetical protein
MTARSASFVTAARIARGWNVNAWSANGWDEDLRPDPADTLRPTRSGRHAPADTLRPTRSGRHAPADTLRPLRLVLATLVGAALAISLFGAAAVA